MSPAPVQLDFSKAQPLDQPPPTPGPSTGGVQLDFSKAQPLDQPQTSAAVPAAPATAQDPSLMSQFWAARPHPIEEAKGFVKGAGQTVSGLLNAFANAPGGIVPGITPGTAAGAQHLADAIKQHTQIHNADQEQGQIAETITELMAMPELGAEEAAAKVPALSEHLAQGARMAKFLEANPKVAAMVRVGLDTAKGATRAGGEQGTQTFAKTGGDLPQTLEATGVGAVTGGLLGGGASTAREVGQAVTNKVGDLLASARASEAAPTTFAASATKTLQNALDRLGLGDTITPVSDYGQAAEQLRNRASSVYDEADRVTEGRWRNANAAVQDAKASGNPDAVARAQSNLDALSTGFDDANYGQAVKEATDRARAAFHDTYALDDIHNGLVKAFDFGSPETAAMRGSANTFDPSALGNQLRKLENDSDVGRERLVDLMGEDGLNGLYDLADVAKNPIQNQKLTDVLKEIATRAHNTGSKVAWASGMLGTFLPTGWAKTAGMGYAAGTAAGATAATAENLMKYVATKPRLVKLASYAAKRNISTRYAATLLAAGINHEMERDQTQRPAAGGQQ